MFDEREQKHARQSAFFFLSKVTYCIATNLKKNAVNTHGHDSSSLVSSIYVHKDEIDDRFEEDLFYMILSRNKTLNISK